MPDRDSTSSVPEGKDMLATFAKQLLATALSILMILTTSPLEVQAQQEGYSGQGAPLSGDDLQQLVAPIALYPDSLVAQVLGAASFPDQVTAAAAWLQQNPYLSGAPLMYAVDGQPWEPSVKAMTQFPSVLDNMAKNLSWTSALGEAYSTQGPEVMSAVQVLRAKAQAAGNLTSGSQIKVVQQSPQVIVIQAANPQVVYVPVYNPAVVYGYPYVTPGYSTAAVVGTAVVAFGVGIAVGAMMSGGCCGWGYSSWNCGWHGTTTVVYRGGAYYGNTAWQGLRTVRTVPRTMAPAITRPPAHTHVEPQSQTATAAQALARRTTPRPGRMRREGQSQTRMARQAPEVPTTREPGLPHPQCRIPMPTGARVRRRTRRTAIPPTPSTIQTLTEPQLR